MIAAPLVFLSWLLIGPPFPLAIAIEVALVVGVVSILRYRFHHKTVALIAVMGLMLTQCLAIVFLIHLQLWQLIHPLKLAPPASWLIRDLLRLDLPLAELGTAAAICVGAYIELGRSRLNLSQAFPNVTFHEPPEDVAMMVKRLANAAAVKCPDIRLVDSGAPLAFTVRTRGKNVIALSVGLLESFATDEVEACIAHEISHIRNRDFTLRTIVTVARVALFTRVLSYFLETAFYRTRELLADETAATMMGGPGPLISALTKLQKTSYVGENVGGGTLCLFGGKKSVFELLSKHPHLSTRIRLLREMESS